MVNGKKQVLRDVAVNQLLTVIYTEASEMENYRKNLGNMVSLVATSESGIDFKHEEKFYDDYEDQILLPHKMSEQGPFIAEGDVNKDGLSNFYVGASTEQAGALFLQTENGKLACFIKV